MSYLAIWKQRCLAAVLLTFIAADVQAGGFTIPLVGGRMSGRLSFVGYPDDTSAIYHNPAGLVLRDGYHIDIAAAGIYSGTAFQRFTGPYDYDPDTGISTAPSDAPLSEKVSPKVPFGVLPFLGISGDFDLPNWRFGLGVFSPHNATGTFPEDGPQRYQVTDGTIFTLFFMPTVAWRPIPQLAIGVQLGPCLARIGYERAQHIFAEEDASINLSASAWSLAWGVGLLYQPTDTLSFGLSYTSQSSFDFRGTVTLSKMPPGSLPDPTATSVVQDASADFTFPRLLRFGVNWRLTPKLDIGADFYWQNYAVYEAIDISLDQPLVLKILGQDLEIQELHEPKESTNSISVTLGGQYSLMEQLDIRAGIMYDQSPYPDITYTVLNPDHDKFGYSLGASYRFNFGLELTLAFVHLFYMDRTISETKVCQRVNIADRDICIGTTEAGGITHGKQVMVLGLQSGYHF